MVKYGKRATDVRVIEDLLYFGKKKQKKKKTVNGSGKCKVFLQLLIITELSPTGRKFNKLLINCCSDYFPDFRA